MERFLTILAVLAMLSSTIFSKDIFANSSESGSRSSSDSAQADRPDPACAC